MELLQIEEGELYVQSPAYVYDMLIRELGLYPVQQEYMRAAVADGSELRYRTKC